MEESEGEVKKERLSATISTNIWERTRTRAEELNVSISSFVEQALAWFIFRGEERGIETLDAILAMVTEIRERIEQMETDETGLDSELIDELFEGEIEGFNADFVDNAARKLRDKAE